LLDADEPFNGGGSVPATCGKHCGKSQSGETIADCSTTWCDRLLQSKAYASPL